MGEENKEEEKKDVEEKKEEAKEEKKEEDKKEEKKEEEPQEIVLRVPLHCEACARKVGRALKGFQGVEDVKVDCKSHTVVIKGKTADPLKVCARVQKKSGRKVEIISPLPKPPEEEKKEEVKENKEEEKKADEPPPVVTVVLHIRMHCDACAEVIHKRIRKIGGVESVVTDLMNSQVIVKGVVNPTKLVEEVYKKTKKQATIVKEEEEKKEEEKKEEEKKEEEKKEEEKKEEEKGGEDDETKSDIKKFEYWPTKNPYYREYYAYPPQIFSDENPNACSVM